MTETCHCDRREAIPTPSMSKRVALVAIVMAIASSFLLAMTSMSHGDRKEAIPTPYMSKRSHVASPSHCHCDRREAIPTL
ncbi:hypothetical protein [Anabaena sp. CCY 9910]|uniref:hypothetical protein n=1 Tax=Anabaena sp. CCY 9910 TaxID=3103870 RepID=UPI0039E18A31